VALLQERVKQLTGKVENLEESNLGLKRQIEALVREVTSLREQQRSQPTTPAASNDDLRELAKQVQEIERKRAADREFLEKEFDRLANLASKRPVPVNVTAPTGSGLPKEAVEHTIGPGDTFSAIAAAYSRETGAKVTVELIQKANPDADPRSLKVGQKILVPIP